MKKCLYILLVFLLTACSGGSNQEQGEESEEVAKKVLFIEPADGAQLSSPVTVKMGVEGMEVEPAGVVNEGKGHHHIIIDGNFIEQGTMVPVDSMHIHYGDGQTEAEINLPPGNHTLTLQFADGLHMSYGEGLSATISVEILEDSVSLE